MESRDINPGDTPETVIFYDSTFFRKFGSRAKLPSPEEVRTEGAMRFGTRPDNEPKFWPGGSHQEPVFFERLGLVVKWGGYENVEEAHCMRMIRRLCGDLIPVPEIYGWIREPSNAIHPHFPQVFIYMEWIPGVTLKDRLGSLRRQELDYITSQLTKMIKTLREIRQPPGMVYVGKIPLNQRKNEADLFLLQVALIKHPFQISILKAGRMEARFPMLKASMTGTLIWQMNYTVILAVPIPMIRSVKLSLMIHRSSSLMAT